MTQRERIARALSERGSYDLHELVACINSYSGGLTELELLPMDELADWLTNWARDSTAPAWTTCSGRPATVNLTTATRIFASIPGTTRFRLTAITRRTTSTTSPSTSTTTPTSSTAGVSMTIWPTASAPPSMTPRTRTRTTPTTRTRTSSSCRGRTSPPCSRTGTRTPSAPCPRMTSCAGTPCAARRRNARSTRPTCANGPTSGSCCERDPPPPA